MNIIEQIQKSDNSLQSIGGKAFHLHKLKNIGLNVPHWITIPSEVIKDIVGEEIEPEQIRQRIQMYHFDEHLTHFISQAFPDTKYFAVRSSAIDEDGSTQSFAGQFESYLYVPFEEITSKIKEVWLSTLSERVMTYRNTNQLIQHVQIAVIIQKMISADKAGVAFGMNPTNGNRKEKMINAVFGLGEGLVSGALDADVYTISNLEIKKQIADKKHKITLDESSLSGTQMIALTAVESNKEVLSNQNILELSSVLDKVYNAFGQYQDIEFAFSNNKLYLLQSRAITSIQKIADKNDIYTLWDNSNIIESYPGVTTPLTFSFISKSYEGAYKLFCAFLGVDKATILASDRIFKNTLGLINGRVYYNLKTWYQMLALLPGYSINAGFMENMMGVKEKFEIPNHEPLSKTKAWFRIAKMAVQMTGRYLALPKKRKEFQQLLDTVINQYKQIDYQQKSANELMNLYLQFEHTLLNEWKAPLLNDFFAMIWFGILQKKTADYNISSNPNIHNDLLCGSNDIISTQPIHRTIAIATMINNEPNWKQLFIEKEAPLIWKIIEANETYRTLKENINRYIYDFGERCIGELKLETISYTQDPGLFIQVLQSYVRSGITEKNIDSSIEAGIREKAMQELNTSLKGKPLKSWWLKKALKNTRTLVSARENLRYERTRAFGIVRTIFNAMGTRFFSENIIDRPRDIFYLTKEEIFDYIEGTSVSQNIKALIELRKSEFKHFSNLPIPAERFATYGTVYHANDFFSTQKIEISDGDLKGIGCCPGIVRAKVKVIYNPQEATDMEGDILVTSSTDPGWVTLFPSASGIIVERGSLLSHSAIVSREMGKPCIVSVSGLLQRLQTGDEIEMDGSTGFIKIIHSKIQ